MADQLRTARVGRMEREHLEAQRTDALSADAALLATLDSLPAAQRALIRLVYGRLDPDHTPPVRGHVDLDDLRRAFPGV